MKAARSGGLSDALFGKTKKAVIGILFSRPERAVHLRELARLAEVSPTMLGKELGVLAEAGILVDRMDGNRRVVQANPDCPIFDELRGIARKTAGLADVVREALAPLAGIERAFIFGSVARGEEKAGSDVDLCVVGSVSNKDVLDALAGVEGAIGRPVNAMVYSLAEAAEKAREPSPFFARLMASKKIHLVGDDADGFEHIARRGADGESHSTAVLHRRGGRGVARAAQAAARRSAKAS